MFKNQQNQQNRHSHKVFAVAFALGGLALTDNVAAQVNPSTAAVASGISEQLEPVVVTGTRVGRNAMSLPMSIDRVSKDELNDQQLQVNLSEGLQRVPGLNIQNRSNYAQDLQVSSRGFGGRASFGVRGIRLFTDGIPASQPDGQGQVSHFALGSADRVEVLRGPFSALYGNASGGVIQLFSSAATDPGVGELGVAFGNDNTKRFSLSANQKFSAVGVSGEFSRFSTNGFRPQAAADRNLANFKVEGGFGQTRVLALVNSVSSFAQDPLGLSRAEFNANPYQTTAVATQFNTRKDFSQQQLGVKLSHSLNNSNKIEATVYGGARAVTQWQSIPIGAQTPATHSGGVIDFERRYFGADLRFVSEQPWGSFVGGLSRDSLKEDRQGYENFIGTTVGITGRLRRNENNRVSANDAYAQWEYKLNAALTSTLGARYSEVAFRSNDLYIVGTNPDDSGSTRHNKFTPVLGLNFVASKNLSLYSSLGKGFETPTLNEVSYRAGGQSGLNTSLQPAVSNSIEIGAKARMANWRFNLAVFTTKTRNEIVTLSNSGGRASFQNAARTERAGAEIFAYALLPAGLEWTTAYTSLNARYSDAFTTCPAGGVCTTPSVVVPAGNRLPGVPFRSAYSELKWRHASGFQAAIELRNQGRIFVNDTNSDSASAYTVANARIGFSKQFGKIRVGSGVRFDNLTNKRYAGSVIVNEANARFFEAAPGRKWLATINASIDF